MRLVNTKSHELRQFFDDGIPSYAILSHMWATEEVLFDDLRNKTASSGKGYAKFIGCCQKAAGQGFEWVWIDTCCIDKSSSAELSEAINSMYDWYKDSAVCYAYLEDVTSGDPNVVSGTYQKMHDMATFTQSRWFSRGWTLQELIAPRMVEFYTLDWVEMGTRASLSPRLAHVTRVDPGVLRGLRPSTCSVAERMRWAAGRKTTRKEDMAYCLLGLFEVRMPLLYGEGNQAFTRLQEQIFRREEDYSIFAWTARHSSPSYLRENALAGLFASSPDEFGPHLSSREPGNYYQPRSEYFATAPDENAVDPWALVVSCPNYRSMRGAPVLPGIPPETAREPPQITHRGLRMTLAVLQPHSPSVPTLAWIHCLEGRGLVCIMLSPTLQPRGKSPQLGRLGAHLLVTVDLDFAKHFVAKELFCSTQDGILDSDTLTLSDRMGTNLPSFPELFPPQVGCLQVGLLASPGHEASLSLAWPDPRWREDHFWFRAEPAVLGGIIFDCAARCDGSWIKLKFMVLCGFHLGLPWCQVSELDPLREISWVALEQSDPGFDNMAASDRAAVRSSVSGTIFHAVIRNIPKVPNSDVTYTLQLGICCEEECEPWVGLFLPNERSLLHSLQIRRALETYLATAPIPHYRYQCDQHSQTSASPPSTPASSPSPSGLPAA